MDYWIIKEEYCHVFNQAQARASEAIASVLDFKKFDGDKGQSKAI